MLTWPLVAQAHNLSPLVVTSEAVAANPNAFVTQVSFGSTQAKPLRRANFLGESPSGEARLVADWVVASRDNDGLAFIVVDKIRAKVFVLFHIPTCGYYFAAQPTSDRQAGLPYR